jgi:hypothetical protein
MFGQWWAQRHVEWWEQVLQLNWANWMMWKGCDPWDSGLCCWMKHRCDEWFSLTASVCLGPPGSSLHCPRSCPMSSPRAHSIPMSPATRVPLSPRVPSTGRSLYRICCPLAAAPGKALLLISSRPLPWPPWLLLGQVGAGWRAVSVGLGRLHRQWLSVCLCVICVVCCSSGCNGQCASGVLRQVSAALEVLQCGARDWGKSSAYLCVCACVRVAQFGR